MGDVLPTVGTKVETDLYLTLDLADSEESSKALVMDIMKGVCEEHVWLNPPKSTTNGDFELRSGDSVWIEITEKPSCIPAKLWQLERACIAICALTATKAEGVLPNALVVCVNGEWEVAKQVAENLKSRLTIVTDCGTLIAFQRSLCGLPSATFILLSVLWTGRSMAWKVRSMAWKRDKNY